MRYRIEYADGRCCNFANSRKDLLEWLKLLKDEEITDIRKIYKNGVTDSVLEKYQNYLVKNAGYEVEDRMKAIRLTLKIMFLPVMAALVVIRLFVEFLSGISAVIFRVIEGIFLLTALLSYGFGLESSGEYLKMVLAGFLFYLLPCTVEIVIAGIVFLEEWIRSLT